MKQSDYKQPMLVGIFILAGLLILILGVFTVGNQQKIFEDRILLKTVFNDVSGLQQGNNIWLSGVKIGTVKNISFHNNTQVEVALNIDKKAQPHTFKDALVKISTDGLIGNKIIVIYGGSPTAGMVRDGDRLQSVEAVSNDALRASLQVSSTNLQAITEDLKTITDRIATGKGTLGSLINDRILQNSIQETMDNLKRASSKTESAVTSINQFSGRLNNKSGLVNELLTDTVLFRNLQETVAQIQASAASFTTIMNNVQAASKGLQEKDNTLGMLLHDEQVATDLKTTISNLKSGSQKLDENMQALQHNFLLRGYFKRKQTSNPQ